jgi:excisionase family DNA binding protein
MPLRLGCLHFTHEPHRVSTGRPFNSVTSPCCLAGFHGADGVRRHPALGAPRPSGAATVYALVERGEIRHLRVSNAMRVHPDDLEAFIAGKRG